MSVVRFRFSSGAIRHVWRGLFARVAIVFLVVAANLRNSRAEEPDYSAELPRIPPLSADAALSSFRVHPDFRLELVAAEPWIASPVAIAFDELARLYVVEMRDYSEQAEENLGRIRLLEDSDHDGKYETATVFAEGLSWPTSVTCYDGGIFVAAAPDIWFLKDADGDQRADIQRRVFTGFGRNNVQGLLNGLCWGLDNRIHGATSSTGAAVRPADQPDAEPLVLRGRDFSFDPRTLEMVATSGGGQHGVCFDDWGHKFVCSNSDHAQVVMFEDRHLERAPFVDPISPRISIASDGPQAEVFRASPVEPWRVVRTRLRVSGQVPGPIEGGGRAAGYFSGASGITVYRGDGWPGEYRGQLFIGDVGGNLVHRKTVTWNGVEPRADRADQGREFVASTDNWFRPVHFANGPDGMLYIVDCYREVIEHPDSLPPAIKKHLDLTSGRDRGRIYRIVPASEGRRRGLDLPQGSPAEVVQFLGHPNAWHRETAARLIFTSRDARYIEPLRRMLQEDPQELGRLHALYALAGLDALLEADLLRAISDPHPGVRRNGVRLAGGILNASENLKQTLAELADDADPEVRLELAFALGASDDARKPALLTRLAMADSDSRWMRLAVLTSVGDGEARLFENLWEYEGFRSTASGMAWLREIATQVARRGKAEDVRRLWDVAASRASDGATSAHQAVLLGLSEGARRSGLEFGAWVADRIGEDPQPRLSEIVQAAVEQAVDTSANLAARRLAVAVASLGDWEQVASSFEELLEPSIPVELQLEALDTMSHFHGATWWEPILAHWGGLTPEPRRAAMRAMLSREEAALGVIGAIAAGTLVRFDLGANDVAFLRSHPSHEVRTAAGDVLDDEDSTARSEVVDRYLNAVSDTGDVDRGRDVFRGVCAACHQAEGVGQDIAPNLVAFVPRGPEALLQAILDPNREVNPAYLAYVVVTTDGRAFQGILSSESSSGVVLRPAEGQPIDISRAEIDALRNSGLSLMPEGLERQVDSERMGDLLAYLRWLASRDPDLDGKVGETN